MRRLVIIMVVAVWGMAAMATAIPDVYSKYYDEVVVGQKWQFEVTDHDTNKTWIANVVLAGDSVIKKDFLEVFGYAVHVSHDDGRRERYFLWDDTFGLCVMSDITKSQVVIIDYDVEEGKQSHSHWGNHNFTVSEVDYVFAADRPRRRMRLEDADSGCQTMYLTGLGLDKFEVCSDEWNHNRSYTLIKTEYPDGTELSPSDYDLPRIVPDNNYYADGTVIVYDWLRVPSFDKLYEEELRVVGDTVAYHIPCKRIERWNHSGKTGEYAVFDIAGQVYSAGTLGDNECFRPLAIYSLEVGDRMFAQNEETEVTDVFEIDIDGVSRRVIKFAQVEEYGLEAIYGYWVEGVGPTQTDGFSTTVIYSMTPVLNGLYRNGEQVFSYVSLFRSNDVESLQEGDIGDSSSGAANGEDIPLYNLQGIKIDRPIQGEPYIRNGRIRVSR